MSHIRTAALLGRARAPLRVRRLNAFDIEVLVPLTAPDPTDAVVVLEADGEIRANPARHVSAPTPTTLHVFHGTLAGSGIRYGDGKRLRDRHRAAIA